MMGIRSQRKLRDGIVFIKTKIQWKFKQIETSKTSDFSKFRISIDFFQFSEFLK